MGFFGFGKKKEKENIKLYRTLGISIGAMLAIFFI